MTRHPRLLLVFGLTFLSLAFPVRADDWKLIGSQHGIEFYRRETPASHITAFKGRGTVEAPLWKVAAILLDTGRASEWVSSLKESRVLRRLGPSQYIEYNRVGGPFIMKDRDFVSDVRIDVDPQAKTFALVYQPAGDGAAPATRYVRGEILAGLFHAASLETGRRTELTAEIQCDPKGIIPAWVINFFQKGWPIQTFEGIRAQAAKPDIVVPEEFADVLAPTRQF